MGRKSPHGKIVSREYRTTGGWNFEKSADVSGAAAAIVALRSARGRPLDYELDLLPEANNSSSAVYTVVTHDADKALRNFQLDQLRGFVRYKALDHIEHLLNDFSDVRELNGDVLRAELEKAQKKLVAKVKRLVSGGGKSKASAKKK